jgi:formylglycine-generating enzyme required for sulfatase activity/serine/threonine protein kinase
MSESNLMTNSVPLGRAYEIIEDGKTFGIYTIIRCLAYDMLGSLYLVENKQTRQKATLFVFPAMVGQDSAFPERFIAQTKKLCLLKHPNLLSFTQPVIIQTSYCLLGEPFEGLNIPDHLMMLTGSQLSVADNPQAVNLPSSQVTPILEQVLAGLAYAHESKTMHLNLNPTKILRSGFGEVKVYGYHFLAILGQELFEILVSAGIPPLKLDPNRSFVGTTDILSPEARLRQELEYRSDVYAIGVNTHWLLTGRKPTSPYQPPSQVQPGVEPGWDAFTVRCLQRKPDERYASANAALADLRNITHLTPIAQNQPLELLLPPEAPVEKPVVRRTSGSKSPLVKVNKQPVKPPRSARKGLTLTQRLLFIGLPSLIAVGVAAFVYVQVETGDDDLSADLPAVRVPDGQTHGLNLWLTVTPRSAMLTIDNTKMPINDGQLRLQVATGDHSLTIEAPPKFRPKHFSYTTAPEVDHRFINLDPNWAVVDFITAPGATVTAQPAKGDPIQLGVADASGKLHITQNLGDNTYTFTATKDDYTTAQLPDQKIELTKSYNVTLNISANPATVTLLTEPANATVRIGATVLGTTPLTTTKIPVDTTVQLSVDLSGYQTVTRSLRVSPGSTQTIDVGSLTALMGGLNLSLTLAGHAPTDAELRDAQIVINNHPYPASTKNLPTLLVGTYQVRFEHPDYFPVETNITVEQGKTASTAANLQPRPAKLAIHPTPAAPIEVFLNNQPILAGPDGSYSLPPNQADKVRVEALNYAENVRNFTPGPNETVNWELPLSPMAPPATGQDYSVPYLNLEMKWIQPGNFTMGSPGTEIDRKPGEGPATTVIIPAGFWAGTYEVTQSQYQAVMGDNPSEFGQNDPRQGNYPVDHVSWTKAVEFTQRLTAREAAAKRLPTGYEFRLPTEAEWEYLARAGTTTPFSFGDHADPSEGNFKGSYPTVTGSDITSLNAINSTKPVGSYKPNAWGLYDVHGNVAEWVLDPYQSRLPGGVVSATAAGTGDANARRLYRGGGWRDSASESRSAWRDLDGGVDPDTVSNDIGMRVILAPIIAAKP